MASSSFIWLGIGIVVAGTAGLGLYAAINWYRDSLRYRLPRRTKAPPEPAMKSDPGDDGPLLLVPPAVRASWPQKLGVAGDNEVLDAASRLDMVQRLALLGEPWCYDALRTAAEEEPDEGVVAAIKDALEQ